MRKTALLAIAACALGALTGTAHAASQHTGECDVRAVEDPSLPGTGVMTGSYHADMEVWDPGPPRTPATATVTCTIKVNGVTSPASEVSQMGTGRFVVVRAVSWLQGPGNDVEVCTEVFFHDGTPTASTCKVPIGDPSPVLGSITIDGTTSPPTYALHGNLAVPAYWACADNGAATPYVVTCVPTMAVVFQWFCDVPRAEVAAIAPGSLARATVDCDMLAPDEVATSAVAGPAGHDGVSVLSGVRARHFECRVDDGAGGAAVTGYLATCAEHAAM